MSTGGDADERADERTDVVSLLVRRALPLLLVVGAFVGTTRLAARPFSVTDTFFHLRFGREFLSGWSLRDPGSVTPYATEDWLPTQWLPQVVMAWVEEHVGLAGVAWLHGLQMAVLVLVLYVLARRRADPAVAAPLVLLGLIGCSSGLSMRPQVISYVLVAVVTASWLRARETGRAPWHLVPLTWLWAMCHGMWPIGLVLGAVAVLALAVDRDRDAGALARHAAVVLASAAAAALTPLGPALYGAVVGVGSRAEFFDEWGPPVLSSPGSSAVALLLVIGLLSIARGPRVPDLDLALLVVAFGFAAYSQRTVPVAAAVLVPLLAGRVQLALAGRRPWAPVERGVVGGAFVLSLAVLALLVPSTSADPPRQPAWVEPALGGLPAGTPLLNSWAFGGYLMWRYPQLDLVMHGYGDTFTLQELERNADLEAAEPGWDEDLRELGVEHALLDPDSPLAYALKRDGWSVVHRSEDVELLQAPPGWSSAG